MLIRDQKRAAVFCLARPRSKRTVTSLSLFCCCVFLCSSVCSCLFALGLQHFSRHMRILTGRRLEHKPVEGLGLRKTCMPFQSVLNCFDCFAFSLHCAEKAWESSNPRPNVEADLLASFATKQQCIRDFVWRLQEVRALDRAQDLTGCVFSNILSPQPDGQLVLIWQFSGKAFRTWNPSKALHYLHLVCLLKNVWNHFRVSSLFYCWIRAYTGLLHGWAAGRILSGTTACESDCAASQ